MALYDAPVWAAELAARRRSQIVLRRVERRLAIRVAMGYRTNSYESAMVLTGVISWKHQAEVEAEVYRHRSALRRVGVIEGVLPGPSVEEVRLQARRVAISRWRADLTASGAAVKRTVGAILPRLKQWMDRGHRRLSFRVTERVGDVPCQNYELCELSIFTLEFLLFKTYAFP
ncbi:uncharacterized protein LOC105663837 [Megachile rotundata]|uniref:uncharacterized protein LOC105663837 n=1 Tax=Megachile rotundata TaxID=143995 RepID=UPI003FD6A930